MLFVNISTRLDRCIKYKKNPKIKYKKKQMKKEISPYGMTRTWGEGVKKTVFLNISIILLRVNGKIYYIKKLSIS